MPTGDATAMTKKNLLWWLGAIALGFTYLAAANVHETRTNVLGAFEACRSFDPTTWFESGCNDLLYPRLGVLAIGAAVLLVCGYFAEKENSLPPGHEVLIDESRGLYWCKNCPFTTRDITAASRHKQTPITASTHATARPSTNAAGFGGGSSAPRTSDQSTPSSVVPPVPSDFKTCPDCAEQVRAAARKCRFCGYQFDAVGQTSA